MFELVQELNDGANALKKRISNHISLNAGCELFIAFVTLFPHESDVRRRTSLTSRNGAHADRDRALRVSRRN